MSNYIIYAYIKSRSGEVLYIGLSDMESKRHNTHVAPSRKHESAINTWLQDNPLEWQYRELAMIKLEIDDITAKQIAHTIEKSFIEKYKPEFNVYGK